MNKSILVLLSFSIHAHGMFGLKSTKQNKRPQASTQQRHFYTKNKISPQEFDVKFDKLKNAFDKRRISEIQKFSRVDSNYDSFTLSMLTKILTQPEDYIQYFKDRELEMEREKKANRYAEIYQNLEE